jgi:hypothetical protein
VASALTSARSWPVCAAVRRVRTRYNESVRSGHRDGSVESADCGSKEVACEASRSAAVFSVDVAVDGVVGLIVAVPLLRTGLETGRIRRGGGGRGPNKGRKL